MFSLNQKKPIYEVVIMVFFLSRSIWALEVILFLSLFHPFFNLPDWHGVQSYLQADDMQNHDELENRKITW